MQFEIFPYEKKAEMLRNPVQFIEQKFKDKKSVNEVLESEEEDEEEEVSDLIPS